jgi:hypothetical protein
MRRDVGDPIGAARQVNILIDKFFNEPNIVVAVYSKAAANRNICDQDRRRSL